MLIPQRHFAIETGSHMAGCCVEEPVLVGVRFSRWTDHTVVSF